MVAGARPAGPPGYTYAGLVIRLPEGAEAATDSTGRHEDLLAALRQVRFTGWLGHPENGWLPAVAANGNGTVAAGRRGVVGVGQWLAERFPTTILAYQVVADRQLLLAAWTDGKELGRYVSDPAYGLDDDTLPDPLGTEHATAFAAACGHPEAADDLSELLTEELDPDSVIESERLAQILRLLSLPRWLVAAASLPRDLPAGPRARDLTRLGAGAEGLAGRLRGWAANVVRRRRPPPRAVPDAPHGGADIDPWLL